MTDKMISTGEASKISGLTVRTLQHYDNIGLLPSSGRTEGGRRYYTQADIVKLQYIVFYKNLGFPLKEISTIIQKEDFTDKNTNALLEQQKLMLFNQISTIQNSIAAIEACQEISRSGRKPPWTLLTVFMTSLNSVDISSWGNFDFSESQLAVFNEFLPTLDDALDFYNSWKRLSIKAAAYQETNIPFESDLAQQLKLDWIAMIESVTGNDTKNEEAYLEVDNHRELWTPAEKELIEKAEPYLEKLLSH